MGKRILLVVGALVLLLIGVRFAIGSRGPDDAKLIQEALQESIRASHEGRPGGVLEYLSEQFKINQESPTGRQIADFIRNNKPDIEVPNTTPVIRAQEGTAFITSPVRVKVSFLGQNFDQTVENVTMKFQREDAREWLIFPTKKWRLVEVSVPNEAVPAGLGGGM